MYATIEEVIVPDWVNDLSSFRRWADSDDYPDKGRCSFFQGELWIDHSREELFSHNQVKSSLYSALEQCVEFRNHSYIFSKGVRLSNPSADLSSQPDAVFVSFSAIQSGRVKLVRGQLGGYVELEGSPELVVEIVSPSSVRKDTEVLRELYAKAGVAEYWLIDARSTTPVLEILRLSADGYQPVTPTEFGHHSQVLSRHIALIQESDPLGNPRYQFRMTALATV